VVNRNGDNTAGWFVADGSGGHYCCELRGSVIGGNTCGYSRCGVDTVMTNGVVIETGSSICYARYVHAPMPPCPGPDSVRPG
jgi:hypothetical protein